MGALADRTGITRRRSWPAAAAAILPVLSLAGCARPASVDADDVLRTALGSDILGTQPGVRRDENTDIVMMHMFEGLVAVREDGSPGLLLARSVRVSADGRRYRFELRPGLRFSNGAPVTAREVVWSWRRYLDPRTGWFCLSGFDGTAGPKLESVRAAGRYGVEFTLDRPDPMLLSRMAGVECGDAAILHPSSLRADGSWRAPVATGPYRIDRWVRGQYITLARNPYYRSRGGPMDGYTGGKAAIVPRVRFDFIRDGASRLAALTNGQLDILAQLTKADAQQVQGMAGIRILDAPVAAINAILIQSDDPVMRDVRMRRALAMAIDRRAVTALATGGRGIANPSVVPAGSPYHGPVENEADPYDAAAARRLAAEAGYHGQPLTLITNRRYADQFDQALLVQALARKAGINIVLEVLDWATELSRYQSGDYQLMSFAYSARADPYASYESMLGDRRVSRRKVWGNPQAIGLLRRIGETTDRAARQRLFDRLHRLMIADVPMIVLFNFSDSNAVREGITGFRSWMLARARLWNVAKKGNRS